MGRSIEKGVEQDNYKKNRGKYIHYLSEKSVVILSSNALIPVDI